MHAGRGLRIAVWLVAAAATSGIAQDAWSAPKRDKPGWITAHSRYSTATITAPTRPGQWGLEVRMPGGTWISCKLDCKNTLREETVDFWREQENKNSGGCPRC